jgi:hypothetical protein
MVKTPDENGRNLTPDALAAEIQRREREPLETWIKELPCGESVDAHIDDLENRLGILKQRTVDLENRLELPKHKRTFYENSSETLKDKKAGLGIVENFRRVLDAPTLESETWIRDIEIRLVGMKNMETQLESRLEALKQIRIDSENRLERLKKKQADLELVRRTVAEIMVRQPNMTVGAAFDLLRKKYERTLAEAEALNAFNRIKSDPAL